MNRKLLILVIILLGLDLFILQNDVFAAKKRIRSTGAKVSSRGSYSSVAFYPSRLGIVINFFNLDSVNKVSYVLSYNGSGKAQGVVGSFTPSAPADSRDLLFGTCSRGACVYHENVTNARLTINFTLKSGAVATKRYLLKVKN